MSARTQASLPTSERAPPVTNHSDSKVIDRLEGPFRWSLLPLAVLLALAFSRTTAAQNAAEWARLRNDMVDQEIVAAGIRDERVVAAMRETSRHEFVPLNQRREAYLDMALPIGEGQTISPPFIVAYMTERLDPSPDDKVLEIGTGSGYQAAVLSRLVREVYSIEIVGPLGRKAARVLKRMKYRNVHTRVGDGYLGWPEAAPFDKIIVTCSPENVPKPLVDQLREGGSMVVPVGERYHQNLYRFRKVEGELQRETLSATFFVPMTGRAEDLRDKKPDGANPVLHNGGFEEIDQDADSRNAPPTGWHYLRRARRVRAPDEAPEGEHYLTFTNETPGQGCQALQGFAVDGREVSALALEFSVKGIAIRYGQSHRQWPFVVVTFYAENRAVVGEEIIGPFQGTFDWEKRIERVAVPLRSREAILRIGLLGAIGQIAYDAIDISVTER